MSTWPTTSAVEPTKAATSRPGLPLEGPGQEGGAGAAETGGSQQNFKGAGLKTPRAALWRSARPPTHHETKEAPAPPLAWLPLPCALLRSASEPRDPLQNAPLLPCRCLSISSPGSTTPAFLDEGPRKFSRSREHDLIRNAMQRSSLCLKKQDLGEEKAFPLRRVLITAPGNRTSAADAAGSERSPSLRQRRVCWGGAGRAPLQRGPCLFSPLTQSSYSPI